MTEQIIKVSALIHSQAAALCPVSPDDAVCSSVCLRQALERSYEHVEDARCGYWPPVDAGRFCLQTQSLHKLHSDCTSMRCARFSVAVSCQHMEGYDCFSAHQLPRTVASSERGLA
jgi:hypothetical protein